MQWCVVPVAFAYRSAGSRYASGLRSYSMKPRFLLIGPVVSSRRRTMGRDEVEKAREEVEDAIAAGFAVVRRTTRQRGRARVAIDWCMLEGAVTEWPGRHER